MLLEDLIKRELKNLIEAKEAKGSVAKHLDEFSTIHEQLTKLKAEVKALENDPKYKASKEKVTEIMEELRATGQKTIETKKYIVSVTRAGSQSETVKYTAVLEEFLPKVSVRLREVYDKLKAAHTSVKNVSPSIEVSKKEVKESGKSAPSLSSVLSGIKSVGSMMDRLKAKFSK